MANILLVDDAMFMRKMLSDNITKMGHKIIAEAGNGKIAIAKYQEKRPDLVIMDITMPEMNGLDAVKEIVKIDPNAKVVMCSAMGQKEMVLEAISSGAKDFIVKPFNHEKIKEAITKNL